MDIERKLVVCIIYIRYIEEIKMMNVLKEKFFFRYKLKILNKRKEKLLKSI